MVDFQASSDKKQLDVGANLFIGNLDENVDERLLYDTFSAFGIMATTAKVRRPSLKLTIISNCQNRLLETQVPERQKAMVLFHIQILNPLTRLLSR